MKVKDDSKKNKDGVKLIKNPVDLQRLKLEKLMKNPTKEVIIPEKSKDKAPRAPLEFIRNIWGSSAGAGSGDFHVYRGVRRREYARQKFIKEMAQKDEADSAYKKSLDQHKLEAEQRTAKKRAKRLKKKEKLKAKKMRKNKNAGSHNATESDSNSDDDSNAESDNDCSPADRSDNVSDKSSHQDATPSNCREKELSSHDEQVSRENSLADSPKDHSSDSGDENDTNKSTSYNLDNKDKGARTFSIYSIIIIKQKVDNNMERNRCLEQ
ncbi:PRKR-interacting protein 1 [Bulinus truncatus]|nr:PRKR-interacting protein 1 [Bulinus truncatus]